MKSKNLQKRKKSNWKSTLKVIGLSGLLLSTTSELEAQTLWAKDGLNLVSFNATMPGTILTNGTITGISAGQELKGIDFRPATGEMYGIGYNATNGQSQLYKINTTTFVASSVGAPFTLQVGATDLGFDFNPTVDRIRITTKQGKNYRVHPDTGVLLFTDGDLAYNAGDANNGTSPMIGSVAYTNSYIGATSTALFDLDDNLGILALQNPPNNGGLVTIGATGIMGSMGSTSELDIYYNEMTMQNEARVATETASGVNLYTINLSTGATTLVGAIGNWTNVDDLASGINFMPPANVNGQLVYALNSVGYLISFDSGMPSTVRSQKSISGVTAGQSLVGLDFRPATGQLYALGYNATSGDAQLYTLNAQTAAATSVAPAVMLATGMTHLSFDFNPTVDRIRVTSSNGNNYRLHPTTGAVAAIDGNLAFATGDVNAGNTPMIVAGAYTNSYIGATATGLYGYNATTNTITFQNPPNNGTLVSQGVSGIMVNPMDPTVDFDFFFNPNTLMNENYMIANTGSSMFDSLYTVNVMNGTTQLIGKIGNGIAVSDIAVTNIPMMPTEIAGQLIYGLTSNNHLISFDSENPATVRSQIAVTGMTSGQQIMGMDVRPATGELYAFGYNMTSGEAQIYTLNSTSGMLTAIGTSAQIATGITSIGFDFNPTVDRIRVTGNNGSNYRFHPTTGALVFTDGDLAYATGDVNAGTMPMIGAVAYTNSYGGSNVTTLYNYDDALNIITTQIPPNNGVLNTIGTSGITLNPMDMSGDMDIYYDHTTHMNKAFLIANTATNDNLYTLNLTTGMTQSVGLVGLGIALRDIAVMIDEITTVTSTASTLTVSSCGDYTSPNGSVYTTSGTYTNVIPNAAMYDSLITINLTVNPAIVAEMMVINDTTLMATPANAMYQWYNCTTEMNVMGETNDMWTPAQSGTYAVIVTNANGCVDTSDCLVFEQTASLNTMNQTLFSVYPNPASTKITLDFGKIQTGNVFIYDQTGRKVAESFVQDSLIDLSIDMLKSGMYLIEFNSTIVPFIKQD